MHADISRDSFDPDRRYSRVVMQQGRFLTDADFNEQTAIQLQALRDLARDVHGPHWGPRQDGFQLKPTDTGRVSISDGHYYVNGILCVSKDAKKEYLEDMGKAAWRVIYLEVNEFHVTPYEADGELVRDPALGMYDTTTRTKVVWEVKCLDLDTKPSIEGSDKGPEEAYKDFEKVLDANKILPKPRREMAAKAVSLRQPSKPGLAPSAEPAYHGEENQLFRVEIHDDGVSSGATPTFKWARDNASAYFPIQKTSQDTSETPTCRCRIRGREGDLRLVLRKGDWVEFIDETYSRGPGVQKARRLYKVEGVSRVEGQLGAPEWEVTVKTDGNNPEVDQKGKPYLRKWESDAVPIDQKAREGTWCQLCDGIYVTFKEGGCRRGDYWLVAARLDHPYILWPPAKPNEVLPYHPPRNPLPVYAPLYLFAKNDKKMDKDLRWIRGKLATTQPR